MDLPFSPAALKLITETEGLDQPGKWPGGDSGISIGVGDDLGYQSAATYSENWQPVLEPSVYVRLLDAIGFKGCAAQEMAHRFADIRISQAQADQVFRGRVLPEYIAQTVRAFPGVTRLPLDAQGALVSLVYNRGAGMGDRNTPGYPKTDSRREMRAIRDEIAKPRPSLTAIADQIRSMKRLWEGKGENGLLTRREAEAKLVEDSATAAK